MHCSERPNFRDLGFSSEESEHLLVRADLLIQVQKAIAARRLKQAEAAKLLRVTQPRVSDLPLGFYNVFRRINCDGSNECDRRSRFHYVSVCPLLLL